jgi:hypothetical protein
MMGRFTMIALLLVCAGCGADNAEQEQAAPAGNIEIDAQEQAADQPANESAVPYDAPHLMVSQEGRFEAVWPSGCATTRVRTRPSAVDPNGYSMADVTCKQDGERDRGTQVTVFFEMGDGGVPTPEAVTKIIGERIAMLGVDIRKQKAIIRNGREGVGVFCGERKGTRQVWIEGFIDRGRVLIMMAWGLDDGLYEDPEIKEFFSSVRWTD